MFPGSFSTRVSVLVCVAKVCEHDNYFVYRLDTVKVITRPNMVK